MTKLIATSRKPQARRLRRWMIFTAVLLAIGYWLSATSALAQVNTGIDFGTATGLSTQDIRVTIAKIIRAVLGLLGLIALVIVIYGGFLWMTAGGSEDRINDAKKWLTNGAIGLTIILLSFSITQFVISRLNAALYGAGSVRTAEVGGGGGFLPPSALAGGCADPSPQSTTPYICVVSPARGSIGTYMTIQGYRFGAFTAGQSKVQIGGVDANVIACSTGSTWDDHRIVVEVPAALVVGRDHLIEVTATGGQRSGNPKTFGVTADALGPQIACVIPGNGAVETSIAVEGKLFGTAQTDGRVKFGGGAEGTIASWSDARIATTVPANAQTGEVVIARAAQSSNGYPFTVTCATDAECGDGKCVEGQCVEGVGGATVGASCDTNTASPACEPSACGGGLRCNATTCRCDEGPVIMSVSPQSVVDVATGVAYRASEDVPAGAQTLTAPNGAPGNYLTIRGSGFGTTPGKVFFLGASGTTDDKGATLAPCASAWSDTQVVVVIPESAAAGPIRVETADQPPFADQTDDARGEVIQNFRLNATRRPGICAITPDHATLNARVELKGVQFGDAAGAGDGVFFGDQPSAAIAAAAWNPMAITATVPNIAEGIVEVRVRTSGELSNSVAFTRDPEPRIPRIREIAPTSGGPGQYVTIRGEHFGSSVGKIFFKRDTDEFEVIPKFPDRCSQNWWRDDAVTIRIPGSHAEWGPPGGAPPEPFAATGAWQIRIQPRENDRASNSAPFTVTTEQPTPGICAMTPTSGPLRTPVAIIGEGFGDALGTILFSNQKPIGADDRPSGNSDASKNFSWAADAARNFLVPVGAQTGPVRLWRTNDATTDAAKGSNPVLFEVRDCRQNGCASGQICCGSGECIPSGSQCPASANVGAYSWSFATGEVPKIPRVVEICDAAGRVYSPSPWDQQGQGAQACVNADVELRFTTSMNLDATKAGSGIKVHECTAGVNAASVVGGNFEDAAVPQGWKVKESTAASPLESAWLVASRDALTTPRVRESTELGILRIEKQKTAHTNPGGARTPDLPRDATVDRHYFAIEAPSSLITDTNGTSYTARVFVRGENPNRNPNRRAGIVIGRLGGAQPTKDGYYQQSSQEVTLDGTWQEFSVTVNFDQGENAFANATRTASTLGFARLYLTSPPPGEPTADADVYGAQFDDFSLIRQGDPCAVRAEVSGMYTVSNESAQRQSNVVTIQPQNGKWRAGTWYEIIAAGDGNNALQSKASGTTPAFRLDGDKDGREGGNYRFRFQTRDSAELCDIREVVNVPFTATATQQGPASASALASLASADQPGLVHLRADGIGDPEACFKLNTSSMAFAWNAVQPTLNTTYASVDTTGGRWCKVDADCGVVPCTNDNKDVVCKIGSDVAACTNGACAFDFCQSNRCAYPAATSNQFSNTATARALRETPVPTSESTNAVAVRATTGTGERARTGTSEVSVRFEKPRIVATWPVAACQEACPNSAIIALTNVNLKGDTVTAANAVQLYKCTQENCRALVGANLITTNAVRACDEGDDQCDGRVGDAPQIVIDPTMLETNTSYRVIIKNTVKSAWDVPLEGLNYDTGTDGTNDAYSWTFRTKREACGVDRVEMNPDPVVFRVIGERAVVAATPFGAADRCAPTGQPLRAESVAWDWNIADALVAGFTKVQSASPYGFEDAGPAGDATIAKKAVTVGPSCTLQCLKTGSRRVNGICGNNVLEVGEECEPTTANAAWCDANTCLQKGTKPTTATPPGMCGNGEIDDGEECDGAKQCAAGTPNSGQSCTTDASCYAANATNVRAGSCAVVFMQWCDQNTCLNKGAGFGSVCGNGDVGDGEDCDDGNTRDGDGCSSRCLNEGTPPAYNATTAPNGILARCGNGDNPEVGEDCDRGSAARSDWVTARCDYDRCLWTGNPNQGIGAGQCGNGTRDAGEQCDDGVVDGEPVGGDGCSANCLLEGSSLWYKNAPSMCGDAIPAVDALPRAGEACEASGEASAITPFQIIEAVGDGTADGTGLQQSTVTATATAAGAARPGAGDGRVLLQCGYRDDTDCPPGDYGVTFQGCCTTRPAITARATNACRNASIKVTFDRALDRASIGERADIATGITALRGAVLEWNNGGRWEVETTARAMLTNSKMDAQGNPVDDTVTFSLSAPLQSEKQYRVKVFGKNNGELSVRAADGVRFGAEDTATTFTTGREICQVASVRVSPNQYLLQRREDRAVLSAHAFARVASGEVEITPVSGVYDWSYAWGMSAQDVIALDPGTPENSCGDRPSCRYAPAENAKNGEVRAQVTATVTKNAFGPACTATTAKDVCPGTTDEEKTNNCKSNRCVGQTYAGSSRVRVFLCENPWPSVVRKTEWNPYEMTGEHISLFYCRDQGATKVCRAPGAEEPERDAKACTTDGNCAQGEKCLLALRDDLPAFQTNVVANEYNPARGPEKLRKEYFFLPRGASYCSVSGDRCDPSLAGACPPGEFCRDGQDAVGVRIYGNDKHVSAAQWYADRGFTDATTPIEIDGYRGVQSGRSAYINYANQDGGVYTNIGVLSVNDGAVPETQEIFTQVLANTEFTTDLKEANVRTCATGKRCANGGAVCTTDAQCTGTDNRCDGARSFSCSADIDCRRILPDGTGVDGGVCAAPKDKLARDVRRLEDLVAVDAAIKKYSDANNGQTPELSGGTYIPGFTTSKWPSWAAELGRLLGTVLPVDPLNVFGSPCVSENRCGGTGDICTADSGCTAPAKCVPDARYEQATCWNQQDAKYARPAGSFLYDYRRTSTGQITMSGAYEYLDPAVAALAPVGPISASVSVRNVARIVAGEVTASGRCGDNVKNGDEACDPPGSIEQLACTNGFRVRSCQQNCQWSEPDSTWNSASPTSACSVTCPNGVVNNGLRVGSTATDCDGTAAKPCASGHGPKGATTEQCDQGPQGGRVRPYGGTVPGITTGTAYECTAQCTWRESSSGQLMRCGDNIAQSDYGEQCDGTANVATIPKDSAPSVQYECTNVSDPSPCQRKGGYCGDHVIQDTRGEECDGPKTRSCFDNVSRLSQLSPSPIPTSAWTSGNSLSASGLPMKGTTGKMRITIETSNSGDDLSRLTRDQIEVGTYRMSDYNPQGAQGGVGLYHRLRVQVGSGPATTVWALAATTRQTTSAVVDFGDSVTIRWDNDWASSSLDSNLRIYEVTLEATQALTCGDPGATNACTEVEWSQCQPAGALCGNGQVDAGEECDDGGAGRCSNDLLKECRADAECNTQNQTGNICQKDVDSCTSQCKQYQCGDGQQLASTCTAGDRNKIGKPCRTASDCGQSGVCRAEACDLGTSNWRTQQQGTCIGGSNGGQPCDEESDCPGIAAFCNDAQYIGDAFCPYGRTCNYCLENTCTITAKQGGYCGDNRTQSPAEQCDDGTPEQRSLVDATHPWNRILCNTQCTAKCPDAYAATQTKLLSDRTSYVFAPGEARHMNIAACRLLGSAKLNVDINQGIVEIRPKISVVIVTDRSGSMYARYNGSGTLASSAQSRSALVNQDCNQDGAVNDDDDRIACAVGAVAGDNGLLDKLAALSGRGEMRVGLVSFGSTTSVEQYSPFPDVSDATNRASLKSKVRAYASSHLWGTNTDLAIVQANELLNGTTSSERGADAKIIILVSDGTPSAGHDPTRVACRFKYGNDTCVGNALPDRFIFTVAFPDAISGMTNWSSDPHASYSFAGGNLSNFYASIASKVGAIADAVAGVEITLFPPKYWPAGGQYDGGVQPTSPTPVTRTDGTTYTRYPVDTTNIPGSEPTRLKYSQNDLELKLNDTLKQSCLGKEGNSNYWIRVDYRRKAGATGAGVTISNPVASVCQGPPWWMP